MDVRNRMTDIVTLRTHALQDFLRMVLDENWRNYIYSRAHAQVEGNGQYKSNYISAYEKMRDVGIDNYDVDDMDVTFICVVINYCGAIAKTQYKTREALKKLTEDRNVTGHSNANEDDEELYLRGLLDLCNLRDFVKTIDQVETDIDDDARLNYRQKYINEIAQLMDLLDEERIELVQQRKNIDKDVQRILNSDNPQKAWLDTMEIYSKKYISQEKDHEKYAAFIIAASDAGIVNAHSLAADWFIIIKKDYPEAVRRLKLLFDAYDKLPAYEAKTIIDSLYVLTSHSNYFDEDMKKMIMAIKELGYPVDKTDSGVIYWDQKS